MKPSSIDVNSGRETTISRERNRSSGMPPADMVVSSTEPLTVEFPTSSRAGKSEGVSCRASVPTSGLDRGGVRRRVTVMVTGGADKVRALGRAKGADRMVGSAAPRVDHVEDLWRWRVGVLGSCG